MGYVNVAHLHFFLDLSEVLSASPIFLLGYDARIAL